MDQIKVYTPGQIAAGSLLGGPIAVVFFLHQNFVALGNKPGAKGALIWGWILNVGLLVFLPFFPSFFPRIVIPVAYTLTAAAIARHRQMTKQAILDSPHYIVQSNATVLGYGLFFLVAYLILIPLEFLAVYFLRS